MAEFTVVLPDHVSRDEALLYLAMKLYEARKLSLGKAAELAAYSVRAFVGILNKHGISVFRYSPDELDKDLQHAPDPYQGRGGGDCLRGEECHAGLSNHESRTERSAMVN